MTTTTPSAAEVTDDPNVREDVAKYCEAWAESSDRHVFPKRAAALRDLAAFIRRPSDPVKAELVEALRNSREVIQIAINAFRKANANSINALELEQALARHDAALSRAEQGDVK